MRCWGSSLGWVLLLLWLVACDSGANDPEGSAPETPSDTTGLSGSWKLVAHEFANLVTSSIDQRYLDYSRPGSGSIDVSGTESYTFQYIQQAHYVDEQNLHFILNTHPPSTAQDPQAGNELYVSVEQGVTTLRLSTPDTRYTTTLPPESLLVSVQGKVLRIEPIVAESCDGCSFNPTVTIAGVLEGASLPLETGRETRRSGTRLPASYNIRHHFWSEGIYRFDYISGFDPESADTTLYPGEWSVEANGDLVTRVDQYNEITERGKRYTYAIHQDSLRLTFTQQVCNATCLREEERTLLLAPNSLQDARRVQVHVLVPL